MPVFLRWLLRLGPINPIAVRLVQNASRRSKHNLVRSAYLAVLILVLLWSVLGNTRGGPVSYRELASSGATSFAWVAYLQVFLICIISPVFMAGAIAQEANPRTWDILLTTPLSKLEIVLGNLLGRLWFVLALLFASLPLFALTQFFGGVPGQAIFASYMVAAGAAVLVGAIAVALSVSRLVGQRAVFAFYVSVVTYLAATIAIDAWLRSRGLGVGGQGITWVTCANPFLALRSLLSPTTYPSATPGTYAGLTAFALETPARAWVWGTLATSVVLVAASTATVRAGGLRQIAGDGGGGIPWYRKVMGLGAKGAEFRPPRTVWANPIAWREAAARNATFARILARWSFIALGLLGGLVVVVLFHRGTLDATDFRFVVRAVVLTEVFVIALVAINMAATAVSREREDGTLDLILTTPLTPGMYLAGKLRGLISYLLPLIAVPVFTVGLAGLYSHFFNSIRDGGTMVTEGIGQTTITVPAVLPEAGLLAALVLVPFTAFCVMVGLHWSLKSQGTLGSVVATVGVVGVISGILGLCGWAAGADLPVVGPALAAISPASLLDAVIAPATRMDQTVSDSGLTSARVSLAIGAVVSAGIYCAVVYAVHSTMVRGFDFTVRKLAGTK